MATKKASAAERLIHAAGDELLANQGHMEMSSIARRAGVSVGLAYHHFGSKTGVIGAVVDAFYEPVREIALGEAIPVAQHWIEREHARTAALIAYHYQHPLAPLIAGRLAREPEVQDVERAHFEALLTAGARNIAQGQKYGLVDSSLDPDVTVAMLMGGIQSAMNQALLAPTRPGESELLDQIWAFIRNALRLDETSEGTGKT